MFAATPWSNPRLLDRDLYIEGPLKGTKFHSGVNPFKTDYNNPTFIGRAYLGEETPYEEAEAYGRQIIERWAKNVKNRPEINWYKDKAFIHEIPLFHTNGKFDLDKFLKYFTITVPPTSRTNGQALAWFTSDSGRLTHRTFYIAPTEPVDFEATRYTWDEATKTLTIYYKIHGLEKIEGELTSALYGDKSFKDEFLDKNQPNFLEFDDIYHYGFSNRGFAVLDKIPYERASLLLQLIFNNIKKNINIGEYAVKYDLSYLKSERDEDIELTAYINAFHDFPEYKPNAYDNNIIDVIIPATVKKTPDLIVDKIEPGAETTKPGTKHSGKVYVRRAPREGQETDAPIDTILYLTIANGKLETAVDTPVNLKPGESKEIPFTWEAGADKSKGVTIVAEINPEKLGSNRLPEKTYDNNKKQVVVNMEQEKVDLSAIISEYMDALFINKTETFASIIKNTSNKQITTDVVWTVAGKQVRKVTVTIPANGHITDKAKITMPNTNSNVVVEVEVNPSRNKPANEVTWANNKDSVSVFNLGVDDEPQTGESDPYLVP